MELNFSELLGKIIDKITGATVGNDEIEFTLADGSRYRMYHSQDCCEQVAVRQIDGDIADLIGNPITMAEESTNSDDSTGIEYPDSFTWTFYKLATIKGYVTITWLGESNGYYSESVDFVKIN